MATSPATAQRPGQTPAESEAPLAVGQALAPMVLPETGRRWVCLGHPLSSRGGESERLRRAPGLPLALQGGGASWQDGCPWGAGCRHCPGRIWDDLRVTAVACAVGDGSGTPQLPAVTHQLRPACGEIQAGQELCWGCLKCVIQGVGREGEEPSSVIFREGPIVPVAR